MRTVIKLGGSVLGGPEDALSVLGLLSTYTDSPVVVVSALRGVTERLLASLALSSSGPSVPRAVLAEELRLEHGAFVRAFAPPASALDAALERIDALCLELAALLDGEAKDRHARVASFGERLSAPCVAAAFASLGCRAAVLEPGEAGLVALGPEEDAELDFSESAPRVREALEREGCVVIPGFHAPGADGLVRLFGRGGSDYSAACLAAVLGAEACVLVKDSGSLLTADPRLVPEAMPVAELSWAEAAALARGGAKIIHPRAVDPLARACVPLLIVGTDGGGARTFIRAGARDRRPRALAMGRGPSGEAAITVAGEGAAANAAALALAALEAEGIGPWILEGGPGAASFRLLVDPGSGEKALRALHSALFGAA